MNKKKKNCKPKVTFYTYVANKHCLRNPETEDTDDILLEVPKEAVPFLIHCLTNCLLTQRDTAILRLYSGQMTKSK